MNRPSLLVCQFLGASIRGASIAAIYYLPDSRCSVLKGDRQSPIVIIEEVPFLLSSAKGSLRVG